MLQLLATELAFTEAVQTMGSAQIHLPAGMAAGAGMAVDITPDTIP